MNPDPADGFDAFVGACADDAAAVGIDARTDFADTDPADYALVARALRVLAGTPPGVPCPPHECRGLCRLFQQQAYARGHLRDLRALLGAPAPAHEPALGEAAAAARAYEDENADALAERDQLATWYRGRTLPELRDAHRRNMARLAAEGADVAAYLSTAPAETKWHARAKAARPPRTLGEAWGRSSSTS